MTGLQEPLMVIRTILAAPTRMMDEAWRHAAPRRSPWRGASFETLRRSFLKIAVRIRGHYGRN